MRVIIGCEFSGIVREAFKAKGHDAWSCDLLDTEIPGNHIKGDILEVLNDGWNLMIGFPPCTHLAVSGARWFEEKRKDGRQQQGIDFFMKLINADIEKIAVENPVGIMSTEYRKPDQYIQPYHFGHKISKKTGLWLKNLPLLQPESIVEPEWIYYKNGGRCSPDHYKNAFSKDRSKTRSLTYQGIATGMANQWG